MTLTYRHTIEWAYALVPEHHVNSLDKHRWVAHYLASLKHWGALEEHLSPPKVES